VLLASEWQAIVAGGVDTVQGGELEKVVLARQVSVRGEATFDVPEALQRLRASYPTCYIFAVARGDQVFLGASPERLARLRDREVRVACLAGSRRRGTTPEEDRCLAAGLLESAKDRSEHAVVVRALREALAAVCSEVSAPDAPALLSVRNVHHLYTPVTGTLANGSCLLDIVARLHPTPAVGGFPSQTALRFIREREDLDRGWYAAPVGWLDRHGEGEFAVALRSALIAGSEASLFAGCGIMADSDPEQEYAESWLKLRPVLSALGGREP
jgi:isochorismate synthase